MEGWDGLQEYNAILERIQSWGEEMLLRGLTQFSMKDVDVLEAILEQVQRFEAAFLQELMGHLVAQGRKMALGDGDEVQLLDLYCRITQYVKLGLQESSSYK